MSPFIRSLRDVELELELELELEFAIDARMRTYLRSVGRIRVDARSRSLAFVRARASSRANDDLARTRERARQRLHRFYVDTPIDSYATVRLSREETKHVIRSLRLKVGEQLEVCDGCGGVASGTLLSVDVGEAIVRLNARIDALEGSGIDWIMVVAMGSLKGGRGDTLVEKVAELGARAVTPLTTARSAEIGGGDRGEMKTMKRGNLYDDDDDERGKSGREGRWARVALAASKQSLRARALEIARPANVDEACAMVSRSPLALLAAAGAEPILDVLRRVEDVGRGMIIVGPEGDFTDDEIERLTAAGARLVGLGSLRLRVETAAISALAAVSCVVEERKRAGFVETSDAST